MNGLQPTVRHPSAGTLVRQLDGELGTETSRRIAAHLAQCDACRGRAAELRDAADAAAAYLRSLPTGAGAAVSSREKVLATVRTHQPRRARTGSGWAGWAAAAAVGALVILSVGVDPVRAWVLTRLGLGSEGTSTPEMVAELPATRVGIEGSVIAFRPERSVFELQLQTAQSTGEILIRVRPGERATAQTINAGGESFLLLPSGLLIENSESSTASYRVMLPPTVSTIVVRVGDSPARVVPVAGGTGTWSLSLPLGAGAPG